MHTPPLRKVNIYMLSDRGGEFTSKQFSWLAKELRFLKVYTSQYIPTGNLIIKRTHPS